MGIFSWITNIYKVSDYTWAKEIKQECCGIKLEGWQSKDAKVAGFSLYGESADIKQLSVGSSFYTECSKCHTWYEYEITVNEVSKK